MRTALLTTILAGLTGCFEEPIDTEVCLVAGDEGTCPQADEVNLDELFSFDWCSVEVQALTGEGELTGDPWSDTGSDEAYCCYPAQASNADPDCAVGRPYLEDDAPVSAATVTGEGWGGEAGTEPGEPMLVEAWLRIAAMEHASVAAFARLTLDLLALGAPHRLIAAVQAAAVDEVEHAKLAYQIASRIAGEPLQPGPLPFGAPVVPSTDPVAVAVAAVREGCLGETVGAWLVAHAAEGVEDAEVAAVLRRIADDEARHAALSWQLVAWLMKTGGPDVRPAVIQALQQPLTVAAYPGSPAHGILTAEQTEELCQRVRGEVLVPAIEALLAA